MDFGSSFFVRYVMYLKEVFSIRKSRDESLLRRSNLLIECTIKMFRELRRSDLLKSKLKNCSVGAKPL